jgi:hypothetical protein
MIGTDAPRVAIASSNVRLTVDDDATRSHGSVESKPTISGATQLGRQVPPQSGIQRLSPTLSGVKGQFH